MKSSMIVDFQILEKRDGNYVPMTNKEAQAVSIGGFSFEINGDLIPFDWDAFYGTEHNKVFNFRTGKGFLWDDYEIPDYWDEEYEEIGISRDDITAKFLASVQHIEEFFVDFEDKNNDTVGCGDYAENKNDGQYKIRILQMYFVDMETHKKYHVKKSVLDAYNLGEYGGAA